MPRLFTAFDLPDEVYVRLYELRDESLAARWTAPGNMHATLHFIGDVEDDVEREVRLALATLRGTPFTTRITEVVAFPNVRRARIIAAELERSLYLDALHRATGEALMKHLGFEPEVRPYRPHVTLARLKSTNGVARYFERTVLPAQHPAEVRSFSLFASHLGRGGARYERVATFDLDPR